jgi:hypothetical protein
MKNANGLRRVLIGTWIGIAACSLQSLGETGSQTTTATVCAICADPKTFAGKLVSVSGEYFDDGMHGSVLTDPRCDSVGIAISATQHFKGDSEFRKALQQGRLPGTTGMKVTGTFVGRFVWHPHDMPKWILVLTEVRDVSVTMK